MSDSREENISREDNNRRLTLRLLGFAAGAFAFGFALVPLYDVLCDITGVGNPKDLLRASSVQAVEHDESADVDRWFVRVTGEEKSVFSVWFHLRQRSLHVETYVAPAPLERHAEAYEYLLRRNLSLHGLAFAIGDEDAVYLVGSVPLVEVSSGELDRLLGSVYAYVEQHFRPLMRISFGSRFQG